MDAKKVEKHDERTPSRKVVWEEVPLPNHANVINDISCHGSIGLALHQALRDESDQEEIDEDSNEGEDSSKRRITLDQPMINQILQSFGTAVKNTQHDQREMQMNRKAKSTTSVAAPAAVLRGHVDHFNRRGGKWRFMVHDAQIVDRKPLDRKRSMIARPSLWRVMNEGQCEPPKKIRRLEVLAYNDIE